VELLPVPSSPFFIVVIIVIVVVVVVVVGNTFSDLMG